MISEALVAVLKNNSSRDALLETAIEVIDSYFTQGTEDSVFDEPAYLNAFNADLGSFLKWEKLGKAEDATPRLRKTLAINKQVMGRPVGGYPSPRSILQKAVEATIELSRVGGKAHA